MYEVTSEPHEFVADDRDEAIAKASRFFGVDAEALAIGELAPGEVYGLTGRALVVAVPRDRVRARRSSGPSGGGRGREARGEPRRDERREERPRRGGRGRSERGRGERGRGERGRGDGGRDDGSRGDGGRRAEAAVERPAEPSVGTQRGELSEVGDFVLGLVERLERGPFEIAENHDGELLVCQVSGMAAEALTAGDGRAVDALQLLANQVAMRLSDEAPRVVIDVEGDAEARESLLSGLAERVAQRARESGRSVALDPMNGRDRRMVHMALRDFDDVATMSVGEGRYRQVVVVPEGAPEYEKARREAEEAAARSED